MKWKIFLHESDIGQDETAAVNRVLKGKWFTIGEVTEKFEKIFAKKTGVKHAFAVSNCTSALHLANIVLEIGPGDEVICPALTFVASANASKYTGAEVVFADSISSEDLTIDPKDIEAKITKKTKAITVVHYAGFSCHMDKIMKIAKKYKLKVIEDCAHAPMAWWEFKNKKKKYVGSIGDVGCFSFYSTKNLTTGEGGMITTNNDHLARKIKLLRSHGMTKLALDRYKNRTIGYDVVLLGYNYRTDEIRSAIGIVQIKKLNSNNQKRRIIYQWYKDLLINDNVIIPFSDRRQDQTVPHIMPIIIKNGYQKIKAALTRKNIQTSKHYDLIPTLSLYKKSKFRSRIKYINNILTLPLYPGLKKKDVKHICSIINKIK